MAREPSYGRPIADTEAYAGGCRFRRSDGRRECLALIADTSLSGIRVARELDRLIVKRGKPSMIVSDNGSELTSNAILAWAGTMKVAWHYIAPGELLNETLFSTLSQARIALATWRADYNESRPHSKLRWLTPSAFASTFDKPRELTLCYANGYPPAPVARSAQQTNSNPQSELNTG